MPDQPQPPPWLLDVIERQFSLAPYVTAAVWERMLAEGRLIDWWGDNQDSPALITPITEEGLL